MSDAFRELLKKIGSGPHTGENLTREEAKSAMGMMLQGVATPAQIGAFLIAHRIKRPTGEELAGMLDACETHCQLLPSVNVSSPVLVFGCPYDGRSRTAPLTAITALILATAGQTVLMHGGSRMPTKYGIPTIDVWQSLGVNWQGLSLSQLQQVLTTTGIGFAYLPDRFELAFNLVTYRDQIGKRPPLATMELIWSPIAPPYHLVAGFVHPPTEDMFRDALALRGVNSFTLIKGLEGSCDLPRERTVIIGLVDDGKFERMHLHPREYGVAGQNVPLSTTTISPTSPLVAQMQGVLAGKPAEKEFIQSAIWNGGFYLWRCGLCPDIQTGIATAETLLTTGKAAAKLRELTAALSKVTCD
ncbi:anthranilate phosphoribosyltransferase family protein [[Phormidium] sp. ETS-05]|uniref:anthranilate phosphoribosyltransferase family protein n=1 Tax=[Phormidium] sp. ETS-05 TaxID=222819 RepID=UPI0018EEDFBE|nr:anthranilate phosphoribosyltransferase family protein [[Phormidium] sp. ETS-05]